MWRAHVSADRHDGLTNNLLANNLLANDWLAHHRSSHHGTPIDVRERFALEPAEAVAVQHALRGVDGIRECLVLNTCNRLEVYAMADHPRAGDRVKAFLCERRRIEPELFDRYAFQLRNLDVIQHAIEVSAGLDSQMVGETDILGQVKEAYLSALAAGQSNIPATPNTITARPTHISDLKPHILRLHRCSHVLP